PESTLDPVIESASLVFDAGVPEVVLTGQHFTDSGSPGATLEVRFQEGSQPEQPGTILLPPSPGDGDQTVLVGIPFGVAVGLARISLVLRLPQANPTQVAPAPPPLERFSNRIALSPEARFVFAALR